jgi:hypothetical protein
MGRVTGLLVLVAVLAAAAVASIARGPAVLRLAEPADATPRSGYAATTQVWRLLTTDASSRSLLLLTVDGSDSSTAAQLTYWPTVPQRGLSQTFHDLGSPGRAPGFSVRGISLSNAGGRWKLALDEGTVKLRLTLSLVRRGATATDWPVGTATGPGSPTYRSTFDWSVPVATARASGWIGYDGHRSAISGWRGYLDHTWGRFSLGDGLMQHWDWAVAHPTPPSRGFCGGGVRAWAATA